MFILFRKVFTIVIILLFSKVYVNPNGKPLTHYFYNEHFDSGTPDEIRLLSNRCSALEQQLARGINGSMGYDTLKNRELQRMTISTRSLEEWKKHMNNTLENVKRQQLLHDQFRKDTGDQWINIQKQLVELEKLTLDFNQIKDALGKEQAYSKQSSAELNQEMNLLKSHMYQENTILATGWNDHSARIENLDSNLLELRTDLNEFKAKFLNLNFDLKAATQIISETTERFDIQQREFEIAKKELEQLKIDMEILEESPQNVKNTSGRLLWRITGFETRMKIAKEADSFLKSPIFYTHDYGYKVKMKDARSMMSLMDTNLNDWEKVNLCYLELRYSEKRILLYLNGLKKWKDRYALLCIQVLKGEYDMTLKWPCFIEGSITLKDLEDIDNSRPLTKQISAKRTSGDEEAEDPQESSSTFIFIPHNTLTKSNHLKDDTIFLDIRITQNSKLRLETNF